MSEKRKPQPRLHPLVFLAGWTAILVVGWILSVLGFWEISWILPGELTSFFRRNLSIEVRSFIKLTLLIGIGVAIPTLQRYWLNRSFGLRLSWWWVVVTTIGVAAGFWIGVRVPFVPDTPEFIIITIWLFPFMGIPASLQWWMLRKRWCYAWMWIIASIISGYAVSGMMRLFFSIDIEWMYLDYKDALELIPAGAAHGLLSGIAALALDWFTRRHPIEKIK